MILKRQLALQQSFVSKVFASPALKTVNTVSKDGPSTRMANAAKSAKSLLRSVNQCLAKITSSVRLRLLISTSTG